MGTKNIYVCIKKTRGVGTGTRWAREEIIPTKVIISAGGFAVAQTTNKAGASWTMCTTERGEEKK